jgi:anaerobic nitric oxide reductase flavorubredoxin
MWNGTKKIAERISEGIGLADPAVEVKVFNLAKSDQNDLITEVFKSKMVLIGSPTIANSILHSISGFVHLIKELKFKNKKAASFGCYGWSGESTKVLNGLMTDAGFEVVDEGFRNQWNPDQEQQLAAIEYGKKIAKI